MSSRMRIESGGFPSAGGKALTQLTEGVFLNTCIQSRTEGGEDGMPEERSSIA